MPRSGPANSPDRNMSTEPHMSTGSMQQISDLDSLRAIIGGWRTAGERVALVPTMGNLHRGHLSLVTLAASLADRVVASVFVNPTQFGPDEDFDRYPRTLEADRAALARVDCDLLYTPSVDTMYPTAATGGVSAATRVRAALDVSDTLCGRSRPGHFDGVVTVVSILFNQVQPDCAVFGEKDYQQLQVIRRLVRDLAFPVEVVAADTAREDDGLALSSRNQYLSTAQRQRAPLLYQTLKGTADAISAGETDYRSLTDQAGKTLTEGGFAVDYYTIADATTLQAPDSDSKALRIVVAAHLGDTRLIDNIGVEICGRKPKNTPQM